MKRLSRATAALWCLGLAGCSGGLDVPAPPVVQAESLDPDVAALLQAKREESLTRRHDAAARNELCQAFEANDLVASACECYRQAVRLDERQPRYRYHAALMLAELGRMDEALAAMGRVIELAPDYAPAHWRRGQWLFETGELAAAEEAFRAAVSRDGGSVAARVGMARIYLRTERPTLAIEVLEGLLAKIPNPYFHHLLAAAYRQAGRPEDSLREATLARPTSPDWPDPWRDEIYKYMVGYGVELQRALALLGARKLDLALPLLEKLRKRRPTDVTLLSNLGAAYVDAGQVDQGLETLQTALDLSPEHFGAHLNISAAYQARGQLDRALEHIERAIASNPTLGRAHEIRGILLARTRRYDEALKALALARRYGALGAGNLVWSARVRAELGRPDEAVADLESALALEPSMIPAYLDLARIHAANGRRSEALATLDRADGVQPGQPQVEALRRRLTAVEGS